MFVPSCKVLLSHYISYIKHHMTKKYVHSASYLGWEAAYIIVLQTSMVWTESIIIFSNIVVTVTIHLLIRGRLTTIDQENGIYAGDEPVATLRQ